MINKTEQLKAKDEYERKIHILKIVDAMPIFRPEDLTALTTKRLSEIASGTAGIDAAYNHRGH